MASTFHFEIVPLSEIPAQCSFPANDKYRPVVLVVDDERVIADTLSIILTKNGFSTMTAYDGESALELANAVPPELLLSDVMMGPGIDGTELAMAVVEAFPDCKVLLFSGHAATRDLVERASESGHSFTLLNKPLHPAELLLQIKRSLPTRMTADA
jgi:DNA-binding NtrC family response regulator